MFSALRLLLPALMPSWRFFKTVEPSPRVQYTLDVGKTEEDQSWQEFRPRPQQVSLAQMMGRMFWNPQWNEGLFMVSCAERLTLAPTAHSEQEIKRRISREILRSAAATPTQAQFRLLYVDRDPDGLLYQEVTFVSEPFALGEELRS